MLVGFFGNTEIPIIDFGQVPKIHKQQRDFL